MALLCVAMWACGGGEAAPGDADGAAAATTDVHIDDAAGCPTWTGALTLGQTPPPADLVQHCRIAGDVTLLGDDADDATLAALRNVRVIEGNLTLSETLVTSLEGLHQLVEVQGDLALLGNRALPDTKGLAALKTVGHALVIRDNDALKRFDAPALEQVTHGVLIADNLTLAALPGLAQVTAVAHSVTLRGNRRLKSLSGLDALVDAGSAGLTLDDNDDLTDIEALGALEKSGAALVVRGHFALPAIKAFKSLFQASEVRIEDNRAALDIDGFGKLQAVQSVHIVGNTKLERVHGFGQVQSLGQIEVRANPALAKLAGFGNAVAAGTLRVVDNDGLTELALAKLQNVTTLTLHGNAALGTFAGLFPLKYIDVFSVCDNANLPQAKVETFLKQLWKPPKTIDSCD